MSKLKGVRSHARSRVSAIAVAGIAGLAVSSGAFAQDVAAADESARDKAVAAGESNETVNVKGKRKDLESPKYTAPILDTPQTITVIDAGTIRGQNLLTLREILSTAPGITFGAGEGGGGYGDSINLRGYAANSDITVDGVRDSAQYTRTDPFNLEQLELVNGANSVYGGSGSLGGSINIVTKTPHGANRSIVTGAIGTDDYYRGTLDADYMIADGIALRLNVMGHRNDVPGRDVEKFSRYGFAPSVVFGLNSATQLTLSYVHQEDDNIPQYGVPYFARVGGRLPGVSSSNYYGYSNVDKQEIQVDQFTATVNHEFNDWLSVRNLTRYQEVTQLSIVDPPQGTFCLANGTNPATGANCASPNTYIPSGPRGNTRDTRNTLLYNQTDFAMEFMTGSVQHNAVVGFSFSSEDYHLETGPSLRNANGTLPNGAGLPAGYTFPTMNLSDPNHVWSGPVNFIVTGVSDGSLDSRAFYAFDTMTITPQFELNVGLRYETIEGEFTAAALPSTAPANTTPGAGAAPWPNGKPTLVQGPVFYSDNTIFSYRFGAVYKPVENASIYFAYGNTETPSQATVNGGCTAATCNVDPEEGEIFELGVKWNVLDDRLLLSASIFQNDRTHYKVASNDPTEPEQQLDGSARVRGLTLSATGNITDKLTVFANYTYLDTEVLQGASQYCIANPLATNCPAALAMTGNPLTNTPEHSGSFWLTYAFDYGITVGYGVSYQGSFYLNNAAPPLFKSDDYWVHSAMISYQATESALIQLNVKNLTDEDYFIRIRNNGWATPGDGVSATLSASYTF